MHAPKHFLLAVEHSPCKTTRPTIEGEIIAQNHFSVHMQVLVSLSDIPEISPKHSIDDTSVTLLPLKRPEEPHDGSYQVGTTTITTLINRETEFWFLVQSFPISLLPAHTVTHNTTRSFLSPAGAVAARGVGATRAHVSHAAQRHGGFPVLSAHVRARQARPLQGAGATQLGGDRQEQPVRLLSRHVIRCRGARNPTDVDLQLCQMSPSKKCAKCILLFVHSKQTN